jgi:hypothetical protein
MCGSNVPDDAEECPKCGEPFTAEALASTTEKAERGSKGLFIAGVILCLLGGPGVALGSYIHDVLGISIAGYDNFESFGWANQLVSTVGIIILVVGIILLILSLPRIQRDEPDSDDKGVRVREEEQGG